MRTNLLLGLVFCGLTACWLTASAVAERGSAEPMGEISGEAIPAAAQSPAFAGTFLSTIVTDAGDVFQSLATVNQDGTLIISDTSDFGGDVFPDSHLDSPCYGSWRIIGPLQNSAVCLHFSYEDDGTLMFIARTDWVGTTDGGGASSGTTEGASRLYFPGQDPLDPDDGFPAGGFTSTYQRVDPL